MSGLIASGESSRREGGQANGFVYAQAGLEHYRPIAGEKSDRWQALSLRSIVAVGTEAEIVQVWAKDITKFREVRFAEYVGVGNFAKQIDSNDTSFDEQQSVFGKRIAVVGGQSKLGIWKDNKPAGDALGCRPFLTKVIQIEWFRAASDRHSCVHITCNGLSAIDQIHFSFKWFVYNQINQPSRLDPYPSSLVQLKTLNGFIERSHGKLGVLFGRCGLDFSGFQCSPNKVQTAQTHQYRCDCPNRRGDTGPQRDSVLFPRKADLSFPQVFLIIAPLLFFNRGAKGSRFKKSPKNSRYHSGLHAIRMYRFYNTFVVSPEIVIFHLTVNRPLAIDRGAQEIRTHWREVEGRPVNARWLSHTCPKCHGVLAVIVRPPNEEPPFQAINGRRIRCGYRMVWAVIRAETKRTRAPWLVQVPRIVSANQQAAIPPA